MSTGISFALSQLSICPSQLSEPTFFAPPGAGLNGPGTPKKISAAFRGRSAGAPHECYRLHALHQRPSLRVGPRACQERLLPLFE
jgi:hypothetical protein